VSAYNARVEKLRDTNRVRLRVVREQADQVLEELGHPGRPKHRGECIRQERPCPWVGCKYNLYLDITRAGSLKFNFPLIDPEQMDPEGSCALDVADRGGASSRRLPKMFNVTRESMRQILLGALRKLRGRGGLP
jgi:hypothetical protein